MKFNSTKGKAGLVILATALGGGILASIIQKKAPEDMKSMTPFVNLGLGGLCQFIDNEHVRNAGLGLGMIGGFQTLKELEKEEKPAATTTTQGFGSVEKEKEESFLSLINPLSSDCSIKVNLKGLRGLKLDTSVLGLGYQEESPFEFLSEDVPALSNVVEPSTLSISAL